MKLSFAAAFVRTTFAAALFAVPMLVLMFVPQLMRSLDKGYSL